MTTELVQHYLHRVYLAATNYHTAATADAALALVRALGQARLHQVDPSKYESVTSAMRAHEKEILNAALVCATSSDYAEAAEDFAESLSNDLEDSEDQINGFIFLHFELQGACDWVAARITLDPKLGSELLIRLDSFRSSIEELRFAIIGRSDIFRHALKFHRSLLEQADRDLVNSESYSFGWEADHLVEAEQPA